MKPLAIAVTGMACAFLFAAANASAGLSPSAYSGTVDFVQHLDQRLPVELAFRDESARAVRLGDYLGTNPLVLVFSYYGCANLCPTQISNLAQRLAQAPGTYAARAPVLVLSIDPLDSPALAERAKNKFLDKLPPEQTARWHFLSGEPANIALLADAVGFSYGYDAASHQYAHPAGFVLVTADGRIARYFFGFEFRAKELGRALDQAGARRIASPIERLLLVCFHFDLASAPYSAMILMVLRAASIAMLLGALALGSILFGRARRARTATRS
jgi:protein SCO1/2